MRLGQRHTDSSKEIMRKKRIGNKPMLGKHHSEETKEKLRKAQQGQRNIMYGTYGNQGGNWRGGKSKLKNLIRNVFEYKEWKRKVLERDNHTCIKCGCIEKVMAHHKVSLSRIIVENNITSMEQAIGCSLLWDVNNGVSLCNYCHYELPF